MQSKITWVFIVLLFYSGQANGQYYNQQENFLKANSVWAFGPTGAGLDFISGSPVAIRTAPTSAIEGCASVSDSMGRLLFYLGHVGTIYNRNHVPLLNGTGIYPNEYRGSSTQGSLIIPVIDTPWKYYVVANMANESFDLSTSTRPCLAYSVVDMTLDNGQGGVEPGRKNIPLYNHPVGEAMIAIPGENCDIWLLTRTATRYPAEPADPNLPGSDTLPYFLAWRITQEGIDPNAIITSPAGINFRMNHSLAVSPNRQRIAIATSGNVLLYQFDPATGRVSQELMVNSIYASYGVCFSPDNTKLYTSNPGNPICGLRQYDISSYNAIAIASSEYMVEKNGLLAKNISSLKLYKDTIYTTKYMTNAAALDRINNPNAAGTACDFHAKALPLLAGTSTVHGLPNDVVYPIMNTEYSVFYDTICYTEETGDSPQILSVPAGFAAYEWDNGATGNSREVTSSGTYWVKYRHDACRKYIAVFHVEVVDLIFSLGEDKTAVFCDHPASYLQLEVDIPPDDVSCYWQDGSSDHRYRITEPGTYWVNVRKGGCTASDTVTIAGVKDLALADTTLCKGSPIDIVLHTPELPTGTVIQWNTGSQASSIPVTDTGLYWVNLIYAPCILTDSARIKVEHCACNPQLPNAFSPNGDGINDYFLPVIDQGCPVRNYVLRIYNRFGECIFYSVDPIQGWDGLYKGRPADVGSYFYEFRFEEETKRQREFYFKGAVYLVR